ncbi:MAG: hypothetical protein AYK22_05025 [Thermoplasmatales archaeon SG8-52-3]|nr:MAG: hypothetical protein AYK22_05025 [Thermoplasmatales archaeon SG8-52-3]
MKNRIPILIVCIFLIVSVIPVSGIIIPYNKDIMKQDSIEIYRANVKSLNDDRLAPYPGDLNEDFLIPEYIFNNQKITIPPERTLGFNNDNIIEILTQIDETLLLSYLENLTDFGPRVTGSSACAEAGDYIYNEFLDMGLEARYDEWSYSGYSDRNIEGTLEGINQTSDEIYIICAHYDSVEESPGADDDGSGTAAVLAAAYLLSQYQFNHTIRFVAFSGEEQGLLGSYKYVEDAFANSDNIIAALNADMIAYAITENDGNNIKTYENEASEWITDYTILVGEEYYDYIGLTIIPSGYTWGSDHHSFWEFGYDSVFYHEYNFNPYWHTPEDTIENMNISYWIKTTRLIIATLCEFAQAYIIGLPPETPDIPQGPTDGIEGEELTYSASTTDPDGDQIYYKFDWGDDTYSNWLGPINSGETIDASKIWYKQGIYEIRVKAKDINNRFSGWSEPLEVIINENLEPNEVKINGPRIGRTGKSLTFSFTASDPENHDVFYYVMWGDGTNSDWTGPYTSGEEIKIDHTYIEGGQTIIFAKAKDQYEQEGEQAEFGLFIIKERAIANNLLFRIIERLCEQYPLLDFLLNRYI